MFRALLPSRDAIATGFNISGTQALRGSRHGGPGCRRARAVVTAQSQRVLQQDLDADTSFVSSEQEIYFRDRWRCRLYSCCQRLSVRRKGRMR